MITWHDIDCAHSPDLKFIALFALVGAAIVFVAFSVPRFMRPSGGGRWWVSPAILGIAIGGTIGGASALIVDAAVIAPDAVRACYAGPAAAALGHTEYRVVPGTVRVDARSRAVTVAAEDRVGITRVCTVRWSTREGVAPVVECPAPTGYPTSAETARPPMPDPAPAATAESAP